MYVKQLYTQCLAEAAYYVESNGEAAIIDPLRDVEPYLEMAKERGAKIKYIMETHFHADFVSGHLDLAKKTGAPIVYGPGAQPSFDAKVTEDGEILPLGDVSFKVLHTPGHTMESVTFLLLDEDGKENAIFTGDTLFIGDVGRPDLAVKTDLTREDLASHLFDSLRNKIMPLPDDVTVYPGHGQGSACGKNMSSETIDTLGSQKKNNYALNPNMSREEFIKELTTGLVTPPQYFPKNAQINKTGYDSIDSVVAKGAKALSLEEFEAELAKEETLLLDTRHQHDFVQGYIPNSLFVGVDGMFANWVGTLVRDLDTPIVFIAPEGKEQEVVTRLSRVGYDNALGYLDGGFATWKNAGKPVETLDELNPQEIEARYGELKDQIIDVRRQSEYAQQHLKGVDKNHPLDFMHSEAEQIDPSQKHYLHCAGGYRSVIAASLLRRHGIKDVVNISGGFGELKKTNLPLTEEQEVETML